MSTMDDLFAEEVPKKKVAPKPKPKPKPAKKKKVEKSPELTMSAGAMSCKLNTKAKTSKECYKCYFDPKNFEMRKKHPSKAHCKQHNLVKQ